MKTISPKILKKVYHKLWQKINNYNVWLVNAEYIRKNLDEDFVEFDQPQRKKYIPKNEFWIDKETYPSERHFFIYRLLIEERLMSKGMPYEKSSVIAERAEVRERLKSSFLKKLKTLSKNHKEIVINKIHKRKLKIKSKNISVWLVNGKIIRSIFYSDYAEGGHDKVYHFIPKNEVWLEDTLPKSELGFILLHELHERHLMSLGLSYKKAHHSATILEDFARRHPRETEKLTEIEIKQNLK